MAKNPARFVVLGPDLEARVERVRRSRAVGAAMPPLAAVLREAIGAGLVQLEGQAPPAAIAPAPEAA